MDVRVRCGRTCQMWTYVLGVDVRVRCGRTCQVCLVSLSLPSMTMEGMRADKGRQRLRYIKLHQRFKTLVP